MPEYNHLLYILVQPISYPRHEWLPANLEHQYSIELFDPLIIHVSINAKDSSSPARYIIQGTKGYLLQKSTANFCGGVTFHPYKGKEEHFNLSAGRPRQAAEFHAFARAIESEDMELCSRMLDTSVAVSRVLETARRDAGIRFTTDL